MSHVQAIVLMYMMSNLVPFQTWCLYIYFLEIATMCLHCVHFQKLICVCASNNSIMIQAICVRMQIYSLDSICMCNLKINI
jgi:hypothetical protein